MSNETVLDVLKAMGKATYREVAARMEIEPIEALNLLREQRELGLCDFYDGGWKVINSDITDPVLPDIPVKRSIASKPTLRGAIPEPVDTSAVTKLLQENGPMSLALVAKAINRDARGMGPVMCSLARQGVVVKNGKGKHVTWSLPAVDTTSAASETDTTCKSVEKAAEPEPAPINDIMKSIPVFTERRVSPLVIPEPAEIARMIRHTKRRLDELRQVRLIAIAAKKYQKVLTQLTASQQESQQ
ncbi:TPA: hypothetical protein P5S08_004602 [Salmonella enterica subsp. enterica serovar Concord]|nr:hypothetical protein [Salmonella enterica subsp. enterica serovar Concord]